jgi:hypothetical protein
MRDFIGRVAARAVGERAAASPRVPSLFEAPGAVGGAGLEVIDEEVVAPAPNRGARGAPSAPRQTTVARPPSAAPPPQPGEDRATRVEADAFPPAEPSAEPSHGPLGETDERTPDPLATTPAAARPGTRHEERAPTAVTEAVPVLTPAVPILAHALPHAVSAPAVAAAEPPPVRVHIGRLEVRANLQEQPRRPERPPVPRPQELSLSDYLRGRRESR